jgi:ubiquitin-conjugating enzyme E2 G1
MDSRVFAIKKLTKELDGIGEVILDINKSDLGVSAGLVDNNFFKWNIVFEGPLDSLYEGGVFNAIMDFPSDYPLKPPTMKFITKMWHPNIHEDGKVCISILHPAEHDAFNEQERMDEKWRPVLGVQEILLSVISMLSHPNIESPANVDASVGS